jgi:DNA repair exonuclease SbcCD ATPase subunit
MLPQRILIKGFLSYRDEQDVRFDGGSLWMLAGPNGSGKSTIFDAVTYALFGQHRGGKQNARELINKESDGLVVEFDFTLDGQRFQARRTLRRKNNKSTRQIYRWGPPDDGGAPGWQPLADTNYDDGFTAWIRDHVGFTFETFTSSVLLLQGKAEKLLAAEPAERFRVLAGIVDLTRYQRLQDRADAKRRAFDAAARGLEQQLDALPEATVEEIRHAADQLAAAEAAREQARAEVERVQRLALLAERWADLRDRHALAQGEWQRAQELVGNTGPIEEAWRRLAELRHVLPYLEEVMKGRGRLAEAAQTSQRHSARRRDLTVRLEEVDRLLDEARQERDRRRTTITEAEARRSAIGLRLRELAALLARVDLWENQRRDLARREEQLAQLPADLPALLRREQARFELLQEASQALPLLRRLSAGRDALREALQRARVAQDAGQAASLHAARAADEVAGLARLAEEMAQAHQQARDHATVARTLLSEATEEVEEFGGLAGSQRCRHCGQALTPGHFEAEIARRLKAREAAEACYRVADEARNTAASAAKQQRERVRAAEDLHNKLIEEARQQLGRHEQAERDACRHLADCTSACGDLSDTYRARVSAAQPVDWMATTYPSAAEVAALERLTEEVVPTRRRLDELCFAFDTWNELRVQAEALRNSLKEHEADLPADPTALRRQHAELEVEERQLGRTLASLRTQGRDGDTGLDRLIRERQEAAGQLTDNDRALDEQRIRRQSVQEALTLACSFLPASWQALADGAGPADVFAWQSERQHLEADGVEARARELQSARTGLEALRQRLSDLAREREKVPVEARREPGELGSLLTTARYEQATREEALDQARQLEGRLADRQEQRRQLRQHFRANDRQETRYRALADLLGRKGLQLHLMRQAERAIVDFANGVLDRLSAGRFCLRLQGDNDAEGDQALLLEAYDRHRGQAFGLPFLSGSQRFRVAVSLALGIGQYASRQHRPIESVIIDEGFGCLDREGRQVMIQELQNLRTELRCILLVSHQEEFADAFADGYRFSLVNGTTEVTRFQR